MTDDTAHSEGQAPTYDPRDTVTPYAFEVDEDLLDTELATPKRRLAALLIDLLLASMLAALGGILVGFAVAYIFFRIATRRQMQHPLKRWARAVLAFAGALVLYVTVVAVIGGGWSLPFSDDADEPDPSDAASTAAVVDVARDSVVRSLEREGINMEELRRAGLPGPLIEFLSAGAPSLTDAPEDERTRTIALLRQYADALAARDSIRVDSLHASVVAAVAEAELRDLRTALNRTSARVDELSDRNEELTERVENPSLWRVIRSTANDFGLRIGWVGVYFTLFLSWWDGQTPGKRALGLRVVRLDGKPLTLWPSFERFGGYAAGLATGLLGFAQVYWDPNRQGIQDRIAHTVVIRQRSS